MDRQFVGFPSLSSCPRSPAPLCSAWCTDGRHWHVLRLVPVGPCQRWPAPWTWQYLGFSRTLFLHDSEVLAPLPPVRGCCRSHLTPGTLVPQLLLPRSSESAPRCPLDTQQWCLGWHFAPRRELMRECLKIQVQCDESLDLNWLVFHPQLW